MPTHASARNAMKHGFCSHHYLAEENEEHISLIHEELIQNFKPKIDEERLLVKELAFARFKVFENERLRDERAREEKAQAAMIYANRQTDEYHKHLALWREHPAEHVRYLSATLLGAEFLLRHWSDILAVLESGRLTLSLKQITDAVLMLGSHWRVDNLSAQARRLMGLYLAIHPRPEEQMDQWADLCGKQGRDSNVALGLEIYAMAPPAETARQELLEWARERVSQHSRDLSWARSFTEAEQAGFVAKSCGTGLGDPVRANEARLFMRYYTTDMNRADKLERKLEVIKRGRGRHRRADQNLPYNDPEDATISSPPDHATNEMPVQEPAPAPARPKFPTRRLDAMMGKPQGDFSGTAVTIARAEQPAPEFQHLNWADERTLTAFQIETMENLSVMDDGPERETLVKRYFGSQEELMTAYNTYFDVPC
jgi:hypothetical protein